MAEKLLFSNKGRLLHLEYAGDAIKMGSTLIGLNNDSTIVLIRVKFYDDKREEINDGGIINKLDKKIGCGLSGFTTDGRLLIEKMRRFIKNHNFIFNSNPCLEHCSKTLREFSSFVQNCENNGTFISRPPGVGFLLCGIDYSGTFLFQIDPLSRCLKKNISSIGIVRKYACEALFEGYRKRISSKEMFILGIRSLGATDTDQPLEENYEIGFISNSTKKFRKLQKNEIKEIIKNI
jgi:20S proteasome subunit alpha 6